MSRRRDPDWRDGAAATLLIRHIPDLGLKGPVLLVGERLREVGTALEEGGFSVTRWNRRAYGNLLATPWPPASSFRSAILRLPRSREELRMDLHASCSTLEPGDSLFLYGARDEGIESALGGQELFQDVETVGVGGRCRVLAAARAPDPTGLKARLADWKCSFAPEVPGLPNAWVSYPGVFAHGRTDPGTRLLLNALPDLARGSRVLDYGCGSGMVGYVVHSRGEGVDVDLLDVDSVALAAARENVSDGRLLLRDGLPVETKKPYDAILSNPPFHVGKGEDPGLIVRLAEEAPRVLSRRGILVFVAQRRLSLGRSLEENFGKVTILAEDATYRVWEARKPAKR